MPEIQVQHDCINITAMEPQESFGAPVGELPKQTGNNFYEVGNHFAGTIAVGDLVTVIPEQLPKWLR